jgi:outer membrane protein, multidrug efflux system
MTRNILFYLVLVSVLAVGGCNLAPRYERPSVDTPPAYKEYAGWKVSNPQDSIPAGSWWRMFGDEELDGLEDRVAASNPDLQAEVARFDEAKAQARIAQANYFPNVDAAASVTRAGLSREVANPYPNWKYTDYSTGLDLQYEIDVWNRVRNQVKAQRSRAQAAAGDLAALDLSLHAELAADYFILRADDAQQAVLERTVRDYRKALDLTKARFGVGYAAESEVAAAEAQYQLAQTQLADIALQRAQLEHAIAILIGEPPARFTVAAVPLSATPPEIEPLLPGTLLERRPDVAAAERRVAAANAEIGVARAAYYPDFNLSAIAGVEAATPGRLFTSPATAWSVGPGGLLNVFDGGRRRALNAQARAAYDEAVSQYRQTVLEAYQQVEDSLASIRQLAKEDSTQEAGVVAARRSTRHANQLFTGGLSSYYDVVTAENIQLAAELTAAQIQGQRMVASVSLVRSLGGGWQPSR